MPVIRSRRFRHLAAALAVCLPAALLTAPGAGAADATKTIIDTAVGGSGAGDPQHVGQVPTGLARAGNKLYVADTSLDVVRAIDADTGAETVVAGNGTHGYAGDDGPATSASLALHTFGVSSLTPGLAVDGAGNLYIADTNNNRIREVVKATGNIITIAGTSKLTYEERVLQPDDATLLKTVRAYRNVGFEGVLRPDHVPTVEGDSNAQPGYSAFGRLYAIGYIRGLREAVYRTTD